VGADARNSSSVRLYVHADLIYSVNAVSASPRHARQAFQKITFTDTYTYRNITEAIPRAIEVECEPDKSAEPANNIQLAGDVLKKHSPL